MSAHTDKPLPSSTIVTLINTVRTAVTTHPVFWMLTALLIIRCGFIYFSPLDLIADESYYWDWSRRLDYGYYSKPPMIAWINWISTGLLGANEFAVRFPAALLGTLGLIWVFQLGAKMFSYRVGMFSVLLLALTPGQTALSFLMTIDAPFLFCWVAALYSFWMMTIDVKPQLRWCILTAVWLGLGILSKQTMLAFYPLTGLYLLIAPSKRHLLLSARLWLTAAGGLLFLLPVIFWNYQHDWITLQHTASHFQETSVTYTKQLVRFLEFFAGQIGVVSPVLWVAVLFTLIAGFRHYKQLNDAERYLLCFSGIPLLGVMILSATRRLEPNWPAACYPAGVILTTAVLLGRSTLVDIFKNRQRQLTWSLRVGLACSLLTYAAITVVPASPLAGSPLDITCRLRGWKTLATEFETLQRKYTDEQGNPPLIIATAGRDVTSALAFYLPEQPLIALWTHDDGSILCQYDMWDRPDLAQHRNILVIAPPGASLPASLDQAVPAWREVSEITIPLGRSRTRNYQVLSAERSPIPHNYDLIERTAAAPKPATKPHSASPTSSPPTQRQ